MDKKNSLINFNLFKKIHLIHDYVIKSNPIHFNAMNTQTHALAKGGFTSITLSPPNTKIGRVDASLSIYLFYTLKFIKIYFLY